MQDPVKLNLKIYQGSTYRQVLRWESATKVYVPITAITKSAPVVITAPAHNLTVGWRFKVVGAGGMKEINALDWMTVTAKAADTVTVNSVNSSGFNTYTTGGVIEYNQPVNLTGYTARMQVRSKVSSTDVLLSLTSENGGIVISSTENTITVTVPASQTQNLTWTSGVYSLELVNGSEVIPFSTGSVTIIPEITR